MLFRSAALQNDRRRVGPALTLLTNGTVLNISTLNHVGPLIVDGGTLNLGTASPNGLITVNGDATLGGGARLFLSSSGARSGELSVTGRVTLAGCSLNLTTGSSTITSNTVVIRNDGTDPVVGTFTGLPEGSTITNGLIRYRVSYVGGGGNSVTIEPIVEPSHLTGIECLPSGEKRISVQAQPGFRYVVEATTSLLAPPAATPWTPVSTNGTTPTGVFQFIDPDIALFPQRFYRAVQR